MPSYRALYQKENKVPSLFRSSFTTGRLAGILLLLQLAAALTLPFILSKPITVGSPAFLTVVAEYSFQIRMAVLLSFIGSALTVYLGIIMFQELRLYSKPAALLFLVVCALSCALDVVHAGTILSMLSISHTFVTSGAVHSELYQVVGAAVASARRSAHATQLLGIGAWLLVFYVTLLRFKMVPIVLSVMGLIGITLQFVGVTIMMILGRSSISEMAMPLLPIQITVAVWLIFKGFNLRPQKPAAESDS